MRRIICILLACILTMEIAPRCRGMETGEDGNMISLEQAVSEENGELFHSPDPPGDSLAGIEKAPENGEATPDFLFPEGISDGTGETDTQRDTGGDPLFPEVEPIPEQEPGSEPGEGQKGESDTPSVRMIRRNISPEVALDESVFPDPVFCEFIAEYYDGDNSRTLSEMEISCVRSLSFGSLGISSLEGLECFTELQYLNCEGNSLSHLDVTGLQNLETLICSGNQISTLVLGSNEVLKTLNCSGNPLGSLDLSGLPVLRTLDCSSLPLKSLDLSGNLNLRSLNCSGCGLTFVDLSLQTGLRSFTCENNIRRVQGREFPVSSLGAGFSPDGIISCTGGSFSQTESLFRFDTGANAASYSYDCGNGFTAEFQLRCELEPTFQKVPGIDPGCEMAGTREHYRDQQGRLYEKINGTMVPVEKTELNISPLGHSWGKTEYIWKPDGSACTARRICTRDPSHKECLQGKINSAVTRKPTEKAPGETTYRVEFSENWAKNPPDYPLNDIPALPHVHYGKKIPGVEATEESEGLRAYVHCSGCGKDFEDEACTREITDLEAWRRIPKLSHDLVFIAAREADCETTGILAHWKCRRCGKCFQDAGGNTTLEDPEIPALQHSWVIRYTWTENSCLAAAVCSHNSGHRKETAATVTETVIQKPDCLHKGKTSCLAVFREDWAEDQIQIREDIPALGHIWGDTVYHWAEDGSGCRAERICTRDPVHRETENAAVTSEVTLQPTETRRGETTYTAAFSSDWAKNPPVLKLGDLDPLPHSHSLRKIPGTEPTDTADGKKTYYQCRICGQNYEDGEARREILNLEDWIRIPGGHSMEYHSGKEPDCVSEGIREHWYCRRCCRNFGDEAGTEVLTDIRIPPLEHQWVTDYSWNGNDCTATRICARDPSHRETETAAAVAWTSLEATCDQWGETTYTAIFHSPWAVTQSWSDVNLPPLGHEWKKTTYEWSEDGKRCTARRVCFWDPQHRQQAEAEVTWRTAAAPDTHHPGKTEYLAQFREDWAEPQTRILADIPTLPAEPSVPVIPEKSRPVMAGRCAPEPQDYQIITEEEEDSLRWITLAVVFLATGITVTLLILCRIKKEKSRTEEISE